MVKKMYMIAENISRKTAVDTSIFTMHNAHT